MSQSSRVLNVKESSQVVRVVFLALLLDLLAFTTPLPLFPRLINDFVQREGPNVTGTLLSNTLSIVRSIRSTLFSFSGSATLSSSASHHWDLVLLGGMLASLFSLCQFIISPHLGRLSDKYGRKPVLLVSMLGNIISALLWLFSDSFGIYALSRLAGGLSEGNVQISIAAITDVTSEKNRGRSLALIGIAFSVAFTMGPSLGAYFASKSFGLGSGVQIFGRNLNSYAVPAMMTVILLTVETIYLYFYLPETRWLKLEPEVEDKKDDKKVVEVVVNIRTYRQRLERLSELEIIHFGFLFFFSGAEFTLTFLTYNLFGYTNAQNGMLLGFIGILSSLLQGGFIRRTKTPPAALAARGILTCSFSLFLLSLLPFLGRSTVALSVLYTAAAGLAFVSATVVNSLNSLASLETGVLSSGEEVEKGKHLGIFRSRGQLGRATGPILSTTIYFVAGPNAAYFTSAVGIILVAARMGSKIKSERKKVE